MLDILSELKSELESDASLEVYHRQKMEALANEIDTRINSPEVEMSGVEFVVKRLKSEVESLEVDYPRITDVVGRLSDLLSRIGI